jgi:hypothetical protein
MNRFNPDRLREGENENLCHAPCWLRNMRHILDQRFDDVDQAWLHGF